jgi:3-hydroxybutyryl-CoA dehydrogenase
MSGEPLDRAAVVGVIGAGTMGAGIAQVAAAGGHRVLLYDAQAGAAARGRDNVEKGLSALVSRGRMTQADADALVARIEPVDALEAFAPARLVIEAIVEDLNVKRDLVAKVEAVVAADAIFATNTSSISITAIARDAARPDRIAGLHFFNPAPVMKLVEIVSGVATGRDVADCLFATAGQWGKVAVHARSTPGFIVNRVARPFYAEALRLYEEQVAPPATLDALLTQGAGFRMGPFALMDLIGHDVNYAVSCSVFDAYYQEPRFRPSIVQKELVDAGRLGRKTGRGFYDYAVDAVHPLPDTHAADPSSAPFDGWSPDTTFLSTDLRIQLTDGRTARELARDGTPTIVHDLLPDGATRIGFAASPGVTSATIDRFVATLAARGVVATRLPDWPGLVAMRTIAMLANEGFEAVMQGVASEGDVDAAMRHGVNYPRGPIGWARAIGLHRIVEVLDMLRSMTGDPRYRASLGLRMAATVGSNSSDTDRPVLLAVE